MRPISRRGENFGEPCAYFVLSRDTAQGAPLADAGLCSGLRFVGAGVKQVRMPGLVLLPDGVEPDIPRGLVDDLLPRTATVPPIAVFYPLGLDQQQVGGEASRTIPGQELLEGRPHQNRLRMLGQ